MRGEGYWTASKGMLHLHVCVVKKKERMPDYLLQRDSLLFNFFLCLHSDSLCESSCHSFFVLLFDTEITGCTHTHTRANMQWLIATSFICQSAPSLGSGDCQFCVWVSVSWAKEVRLNLDAELGPPAPLGLTDRQTTVGLWSRSARLHRAATERAPVDALTENLISSPARSVVDARSRWPRANHCRQTHDPSRYSSLCLLSSS